MIISNEQYFSRKARFKQFRKDIKNQILTLAVFTVLCVGVAALITKSKDQTNYTFYYAQNKVVNKHTRGVFPPLNGDYWSIYGSWAIIAKIGNTETQLEQFKNYTLIFQQANRMLITKRNSTCSASKNVLMYQWHTYSYNIFISKSQVQVLNDDTQNTNSTSQNQNNNASTNSNTENKTNNLKSAQKNNNNNKDSDLQSSISPKNETQVISQKCFDENQQILGYINSFTVWTMHRGNIYLISQAITDGIVDISIFVLAKA